MKRLLGGRARLVAIGVALVVLATASSCGAGGGGQKVAKPVITPKQAVSVVMKLDRENAKAIEGLNESALPSIDTNPALTLDQSAIQTVKALNTSVTAYRDVSAAALVPKQTAFPAWFLALTKDDHGDTGLNLYSRQSLTSAWKLTLATSVEGGPIQWRKASGGWAIRADLNVDPSQTLSDYWNAVIDGGNPEGAGVAPGSMTSGIASQIESTTASNESHGWAIGHLFSAAGTLPEAVRLSNGGVLGFAWVNELLKTRPTMAPCFLQPGTNGSKWDPLVPNGNYQELQLNYAYLEGMVEPATGDLSAVSLGEGTSRVTETPCPG